MPETIEPSVISDLDATPLPTSPILPYVECVHDRIAIEIMRGCPWQCRFCQSTVIKRPLRIREVETIVQAALESHRRTGHNEISLLSLSTSDYPYFEPLVRRMKEVFSPLGVSIAFPSLRVNEALKVVASLIGTERHSGMTLAPEVARDDMREQIRKKISNQDLYDGCRDAFKNGIDKVKLYFMCGLPGEREVDLNGIVEMAETIAEIGREVRGKYAKVTASVSNFVPKPHTPYQWNGMQRREYFHWAHQYLKRRVKIRAVQVKCHHVETSLLEGLLSRGDRRVAQVVELAWRRGARLDSWSENLQAGPVVAMREGLWFGFRSNRSPPGGNWRSAPLGPHQREKRPHVFGERTRPQRGSVSSHGRCRVIFRYSCRVINFWPWILMARSSIVATN